MPLGLGPSTTPAVINGSWNTLYAENYHIE